MISIYFKLDKRGSKKEVKVGGIVKYTFNDQLITFRFPTDITCGRKNFKGQRFSPGESESALKNERLKKIKDSFRSVYTSGLNSGQLPGPDDFKSKVISMINTVTREKTIIDHLDDYISNIVAKNKSRSFIHNMRLMKIVFETLKSQGVQVDFNSIDNRFETAFREYLKEKKYAINTIRGYINRLKIFMNWGFRNNLHRNLIFKQFEMKEEKIDVISLTELEVEKIANLKLPTHKHIKHGGLKVIRDWIIIATQSALRYSDWKKLNAESIIPLADGFNFNISIKTTKTKAATIIPVNRLLKKILDEYNFNPPPPPSLQKCNKGLGKIAQLAGINKTITTHTGRKTFCTIQYRKGVPVPFIMKISTHKTEKEFYKYIGVSLIENASLVRSMVSDFNLAEEPKPKMIVSK